MISAWIPYIDQHVCTVCGDCVTQCPTGALGWKDGKVALVRSDVCTYCATCEDICLMNAIEVPFIIVEASEKK